MGKTVFAELDEVTFNKIRTSRNMSGMVDEKKFFRKLSEGDSVIFSCRGKKIEAYLKKIRIYDTLGEYLKDNNEISVLEINSKNPLNFFSTLSSFGGEEKKRVKIYEVDYHPYGEDDDDENSSGNINSGPENIAKFIEALIGNSCINKNKDDDRFNYGDDDF